MKRNYDGKESGITKIERVSINGEWKNITNKKKKTIFIKKAKLKHGKSKLDYSRVVYTNNHTNVEIGCLIHGFFNQRPNNHLNGAGCPVCSKNDRCTKEKFIEKSILKHGNKYDYTKFIYVDYTTKGKIVCSKHGSFWQRPSSHISGKGCLKCGKENSSLVQRSNNDEFIKKVKKKHKTKKYDYSKVNYINNNTDVEIICPNHGPFFQPPQRHLRGNGCPKCTSRVSKPEIEFLNYLKIPNTKENRQVYIGKKKVDGLIGNIVYEFLGDYYHGNPRIYKSKDYNQICHKTFGELYRDTFKRFRKLEKLGYKVNYIWESDWKNKSLSKI
jgi:hypothetical protein